MDALKVIFDTVLPSLKRFCPLVLAMIAAPARTVRPLLHEEAAPWNALAFVFIAIALHLALVEIMIFGQDFDYLSLAASILVQLLSPIVFAAGCFACWRALYGPAVSFEKMTALFAYIEGAALTAAALAWMPVIGLLKFSDPSFADFLGHYAAETCLAGGPIIAFADGFAVGQVAAERSVDVFEAVAPSSLVIAIVALALPGYAYVGLYLALRTEFSPGSRLRFAVGVGLSFVSGVGALAVIGLISQAFEASLPNC